MSSYSSSIQNITIASRKSRLALWQAEYVKQCLESLYPQMTVNIFGLSTRGDQILDRPLSKIGGKGLFIKELEAAMQNGEADLAVHSLKDVPMQMPEGFLLSTILARESAQDAFVSNQYASLSELPAGAIVGTASQRREAIVRANYPHLEVKTLRGNLDTRLKKLDCGEYSAIILAAVGLSRLNMESRIRQLLPPEQSLPAPGQGALGIEILESRTEMAEILAPLHDLPTAQCVLAERAFSRALGGSCQTPLGGFAILEGNNLQLRGFVSSCDGTDRVNGELSCTLLSHSQMSQAEQLGLDLARHLREQGAERILGQIASENQ